LLLLLTECQSDVTSLQPLHVPPGPAGGGDRGDDRPGERPQAGPPAQGSHRVPAAGGQDAAALGMLWGALIFNSF